MTRRLGDLRQIRLRPDSCHGPHGAQLGMAYLLGDHERVEVVMPFEVSGDLPQTPEPVEMVDAILRYVPPSVDRRRILGGAVITPCLTDTEADPFPEYELRWQHLSAFLLRTQGAATVPVHEPDVRQLDRNGIGSLTPKAAGAHRLDYAIVMPNPYPAAVSSAVQLTTGDQPVYGAVHEQFTELIIDRSEIA